MPALPSSPGAVQFRVMDVWLMNVVDKSAMSEGGVSSGAAAGNVVNVLSVETEVLLLESLDFTLKLYVVLSDSPVIVWEWEVVKFASRLDAVP